MNEQLVVSQALPKRRRMSRASEREEWIRRYRESGLSVLQFCDEHKFAPQTFYGWLAKSRSAQGQSLAAVASTSLPAFSEIKLEASNAPSRWAAELCRPSGVILRVGPHLPAALLEQLLRLC